MRFVVLLLLGCLFTTGTCRPAGVEETNNERDTEEAEYESDGNAFENDSQLEEQHPNDMAQEDNVYADNETSDLVDNSDAERPALDTNEKGLDRVERQDEKTTVSDEPSAQESEPKHLHKSNKDFDEPESSNHREFGNFEDDNQANKEYENDESSDGNEVSNDAQENRQLSEKVDGANDSLDQKDKVKLARKRNSSFGTKNGYKFDESNRDRREVTTGNEKDISQEDEESIIKKHVKMLSSEELEQLMNSLSEDKKVLLQKIIGKREITKKAGAQGDISFIDSSQLDLNKIQGSTVDVNTEGTSQNTEVTETSKSDTQSDSELPSSSKEAETTNKIEGKVGVSKSPDEENKSTSLSAISPDPNIEVKIKEDPAQLLTKTNKREISNDDLKTANNNDDSMFYFESELDTTDNSKEPNYFDLEADDSLSSDNEQLQNEELSSNVNNIKRDTSSQNNEEIAQSMKTLEESFPNPMSCDESGTYSRSDMAPLIRVKRKGDTKKRSLDVLPESKVAFFPNKIENDDDDNNESNEFDEDGFYDRMSNIVKNNEDMRYEDSNISDSQKRMNSEKATSFKKIPDDQITNEESANESANIGTDTDNVPSEIGSEDESIGNNYRNRRSENENTMNDVANSDAEETDQDIERSLGEEGVQKLSAGSPKYQENDAFGPLPKNYEGDLNRSKRIRRVKHNIAALNANHKSK